MLALDPLETLDDVFSGSDLNITALLRRYRGSATIPAINTSNFGFIFKNG